jgi:hypothetical protein
MKFICKKSKGVIFVFLLLIIPALLSCQSEANKDWVSLFDGKTFNGWRGLGRTDIPQGHWEIDDGCIKKIESGKVPVQADGQPLKGGDIMTVNAYRDFEFYFEWRISEGGNSGVKYNVSEEMSASRGSKHSALGFEYQVIDGENYKGSLNPTQRAAALYDILPAQNVTLKPVGEFNSSRIVLNGTHGEHWLNGVKVLDYELGTAPFDSLIAKSKFRDIPNFGHKRKGHIIIQDHTDAAWYRNLKIRILNQ